MSKAVKSGTPKGSARGTGEGSARPGPVFKAPLKPRRTLFYGLLGVVAVWVGALLVLYFVTVFPHRGEQPAHERVEPNSGMTVPR